MTENKSYADNIKSRNEIRAMDAACDKCVEDACFGCPIDAKFNIELGKLSCYGCRHNEACTSEPRTCGYWS
jgi:hypothetical protein